MVDTNTAHLKLVDQTNGGNSTTWGDIADANFGKIDAAHGSVTALTITGGSTTLSETQERVNVILLTGTLASNHTINFSGRGGKWIIVNGTSGSFSVTAKVTAQTGITVPQGKTLIIFCNGTDIARVYEDVTNFVEMTTAAFAAEVTVASATTTNALGAASLRVQITGTTTITSLGTGTNRLRVIRFAGALTLTHNATTLILPGGANITTAAGDVAIVVSDASSNARVVSYTKASGKAVVPPTFAEVTSKPTTLSGYGITDAAAKSQTFQETVYLEFPSAKDYEICPDMKFAATVAEITTKTESGTASVQMSINSTPLGGITANAAATTKQTKTPTSANTLAIGDSWKLTVSSLSSCVGLQVVIKFTRSLG